MSDRTTTTRRRVVQATGTLATLGLAGCTGYSGTAGSGGADASTATPTATEAATETEGHHEEEEHHTEEGHHDEGGHGSEGPAEHVEVEMLSNDSGHHFHPHVAWVEPGGTVTFHNVSGTHSAAAYHPENDRPQRIPDGAEPFDSGLLSEEGETFEHTFEEEGVYDIYCAPHESVGMIGTVLVGQPDPHGQPGLAEPQERFGEQAAAKMSELNHQVDETLGHTHGDETATATEEGGHEEDGHHEETATDHHEEDGHHDETETEHHEEDGHHEETATDHHDETEHGH